jgi:hypothetical protein
MLCFVVLEPTTRLRHRKRRSANVQLQMSFLESPSIPGAAPVWGSLDAEPRAEVVAALARLLAKVAAPTDREPTADTEEKGDE